MSSESFADLGVSGPVVGALAEHGFTEPFAVQRLAIADVLNGDDVLVQSPTGSGKTLAFGVPIVAFGFYGSSISNYSGFGNFAPTAVHLDDGEAKLHHTLFGGPPEGRRAWMADVACRVDTSALDLD